MPSLTDSIGRVLGGRYRLVTPVGTGASAHVYLADDVSLKRQVAIKVLHPALAGDQAFLRRFRAEARAVAALNHPNVLRVYDWGEQDGEPYLVLEYLAGGSLRQIYDTRTLLTPQQAVRIGIEACAGLDYAHRRGLIHRDIKPANLLFDADGRLRIADFGLARALAEAAWTEPDGAILGTARYAAPEQVEGWVLDGKADVYGVALVLYEGVTGESPFIGDTTIATLMARIGALLPEHEALGPLGDVLVWAAAPDPAERYDAAQFGAKLVDLATSLPEPAPLPLVATEPADTDPFVMAAAVGLTTVTDRPGLPVVRPGSEPIGDVTELGLPGTADPMGPAAAPAADTEPDTDAGSDTETPRHPRRRWPLVVALCVLVTALVGAGIAWAAEAKVFTPSGPVPELVGRSLPAATSVARAAHLEVQLAGRRTSITVPAGVVISQRPAARSGGRPVSVKHGSTIQLVVSSGLPQVPVPNVTTFSNCHDAVAALAAVHLVGVCPAAAAVYDSSVGVGGVVRTEPAGSAPYGSTVTVVVSKGHAPVVVPAVSAPGSTYATAAAALTAAGFAPVQAQMYSSTVPVGQVISTVPDPSAGPVAFGSQVTVNISLGPKPVNVPSLVSRSSGEAVAALAALGLHAGGPYGPPGSRIVVSTSPDAGTSVPVGSTVQVYTG
jgi:beta-lactam-binding protein with PASTA domain/tRNA A-37 threonylcarbamoyl transferase component Bud32